MGIELPRIHHLSLTVANQIAAGEVIERPASVVKELLENALDATADAIVLDIGFGGLNHIKISDNGQGICADDLPLAIAPHATSKITDLNDLYAISSMGFRGEALASIAAVSRFSICSRPATQPHAMVLSNDEKQLLLPCARNQGTTVEVRDLFFNVPVRKKFLKTAQSEYLAIEAVVKRFALSAPHIAITLKHNEKQMLLLPAAHTEQTTRARVQKLLGKAFLDHSCSMDVSRAGMHLRGWISSALYQRNQNDKQWVYVNQRMVKDKLILHAIKQAYEPILYPGKQPACLLYLTILGDEVDVNVHPTKHEVRFQQPRLVHDFVTSQIAQTLAVDHSSSDLPRENLHSPLKLMETNPPFHKIQAEAPLYPATAFNTAKQHADHAVLCILNPHFAIVRLRNDSYLVNMKALQQHFLQHGVMMEALPLKSRPLLVPVTFTIAQERLAWFEQQQDQFAEYGVHFDFVSDTKIMVRTIPLLLPALDLERLFTCMPGVEHSQFRATLLACQSFDAQQLSADEQENLLIYWHEQQSTSDAVRSFCLCLNEKNCEKILK